MSEKENPLEDAVELGYKAAENGKNLDWTQVKGQKVEVTA